MLLLKKSAIPLDRKPEKCIWENFSHQREGKIPEGKELQVRFPHSVFPHLWLILDSHIHRTDSKHLS
jgi:hypothetical protein